MNMKSKLSVAFWDYDRTAPLVDGRVHFEGHTADFKLLRPQDTFVRAFGSAEFDVCELSLSRHAQAIARGDSHYVGLPIFLSRCFRHASVYVRAGIRLPEALRQGRIGLGNYDDTAAVVVRALLRESHDVDPAAITWIVGDVEPPFRNSIPLQSPRGINVQRAPKDVSLDSMLLSGDLDAIIGLTPPPAFRAGRGAVKRLYPDWRSAEEAWYQAYRIFPIMHLVGVRRDLADDDPHLLEVVYTAFRKAAQIALENLSVLQASKTMLPWIVAEYERTRQLMGDDFWSYGVAANRSVLDWTLRNLASDGLLSRPLIADELFAPGYD